MIVKSLLLQLSDRTHQIICIESRFHLDDDDLLPTFHQVFPVQNFWCILVRHGLVTPVIYTPKLKTPEKQFHECSH